MSALTHAGAYHFCHVLREYTHFAGDGRGLVIGYGRGHEASFLAQQLQVPVIGIDLFPPEKRETTEVQFLPVLANTLNLPFPDQAFALVFCHHVIEHVADPPALLLEIKRVLRFEGWLYIGTPNRNRIIGYIGSHGATLRQKVLWNLIDYRDRLCGRFTNEMGAHAGFNRRELQTMLQEHFSKVYWLTEEYLKFKYSDRLPDLVLRFLTLDRIVNFAAPAFYALCRK